MAAANNSGTDKTPAAANVKQWKCENKCYFNKTLYKPGDILATNATPPSDFFKEVK